MKSIYKHKFPIRFLLLFALFLGTLLLSFFIYLFSNEIYPDIWAFAGPLLALALIITGLTNSKIKEVIVNTNQEVIEIHKESLFLTTVKRIKFQSLAVQLKTANGKKNSAIPKLRLVILEDKKEVEELLSNFLSMNNSRIKSLYEELKALSKRNNPI